MPATGSSRIDEIVADVQAKDSDSTSSGAANVVFLPVACLTASSFSYLFNTQMFDMAFSANMPVYGVVTVVTVALLFSSYSNVASGRFITKAREFGVIAGAGERFANLDAKCSRAARTNAKAAAKLESQVFQKSAAFSLWKNNFIFVSLALFFGFVLFRPMITDFPQVNYTLTMLIPAFVLFWLSSFSQ